MVSIFRSPPLTTVILHLLYASLIYHFSITFAEAEEFPFPEKMEKQYANMVQPPSGEIEQTGYLTHQFQERIRNNEDEIRFLINEKDWLQNRIYHLQDLNEPVPWNMHNSMAIKEKKIRAAFRENGRLNELLKQNRYITGGGDTISSYPSTSHFKATDMDSLKERLSQDIRNAGLDEWLKITGNGNQWQLENVLPILFASGSARLANEYRLFLKRLAELIRGHDMKIRIDGFADVDNIHTKQYPSNFELGAIRAANIVHELVKNGVNPSMFQIATTGKYRLDGKVMSNNKSIERRAEISIKFFS